MCASDIFLWYSTAKRENCCAYTTKWWSIVRACRGFIPFFLPLPPSLFFSLLLCLFCLIVFSRGVQWRNWYLISRDLAFYNIFTYTRKLLLLFSQQSDVRKDGNGNIPLVKIFASLNNIGVDSVPFGFSCRLRPCSFVDRPFYKIVSNSKNKIDPLCFRRNLWIWVTDLLCRSISRYSILMH